MPRGLHSASIASFFVFFLIQVIFIKLPNYTYVQQFMKDKNLFPLKVFFVPFVLGHGRLIEPPSRASMWRFGFKNPPDYDDTASYCGGITVSSGIFFSSRAQGVDQLQALFRKQKQLLSQRQHKQNGGKCGICGDAYDIPPPRPHEAGGKFANGIIVRKYQPGMERDSCFSLTIIKKQNISVYPRRGDPCQSSAHCQPQRCLHIQSVPQ